MIKPFSIPASGDISDPNHIITPSHFFPLKHDILFMSFSYSKISEELSIIGDRNRFYFNSVIKINMTNIKRMPA